MTQKDRILERLKTGKWLSTVEATKDMYILRLGARIYDLRAYGHNIIERKVLGKSYSEYKLIPAVAPTLPPAFAPKPIPPKRTDAENQQQLFTHTA